MRIENQYVIRKLLYTVPILLGITTLCFFIFQVVGGDPAYEMAGRHATPDQVDSIRAELGLNQPLLSQYATFVRRTFTFDWGESWQTKQPINQLIYEGIGPSLSLTFPAFFLSFFFCLVFALICARNPNSLTDRSITSVCLGLLSVSLLVYIIFFQYLFAYKLAWFPVNGWNDGLWDRIPYLLLPWIIAIFTSLGPNILIYRSALLNEVNQEYVQTGRAKGLSESGLYFRHVLKNAFIPILTLVTLQLPHLITGSLLLESFFGIPGLGRTLINAIQNADFPVIRSLTIVLSFAYMLFNLLTDLLYSWIDPRVKLS